MNEKAVHISEARLEEIFSRALDKREGLKLSDNYHVSNGAKVLAFMKVFDQCTGEDIFDGRALTLRLLSLRERLIEEEATELRAAVEAFCFWATAPDIEREAGKRAAFVEVVDSLAGLLYSVYGFFHAFGVDPEAALDIIHVSNMTKLDAHGAPIYREDGKVLKGPNYEPPDFGPLLREYLAAFSEVHTGAEASA